MPTSVEQRRRHLALGVKANVGAAEVRRELRTGSLTLAQALADERAGPIELLQLCKALPGHGQPKALVLLARAGVRSNRRVRELTEDQRDRLVRALGDPLFEMRW